MSNKSSSPKKPKGKQNKAKQIGNIPHLWDARTVPLPHLLIAVEASRCCMFIYTHTQTPMYVCMYTTITESMMHVTIGGILKFKKNVQ